MANTSSAKKVIRKISRRTAVNKSRRSRVSTFVRKVEEAISEGKKDEALKAFRLVEPELMRAAQKRTLPRNAAARKVSRLSKKVKSL